jgi:C-terminal processing protease CtpA/Prc
MAYAEVAEYQSRRGQGWLPAVMDELSDNRKKIKSRRSAQKVLVLTDTGCKDEAEIFCLAAREMTGIQLVGRPTGGTFEYSNPVTMDYGYGMTFTYPISKSQRCMDGKGFQRRGIPVDVDIPWSKAEIDSDEVLNAAIQL